MGANDLTSVQAVKAWAKILSGNADDVLLASIVSGVSVAALQKMQRPTLFRRTVSARLRGSMGRVAIIPSFPVISIAALSVDGTPVPATGYALDPYSGYPPGNMQTIALQGLGWSHAPGGNMITYTEGYFVDAEPVTIAANVTVAPTYGVFGRDDGVTKGGVPMVHVATAPTAGQYALDPATPGKYIFNVADVGASAAISYSFVPFDIALAVTEWAGERYQYRTRPAQLSHTIGNQQTTSFDLSAVPKFVASVLNLYTSKVPA